MLDEAWNNLSLVITVVMNNQKFWRSSLILLHLISYSILFEYFKLSVLREGMCRCSFKIKPLKLYFVTIISTRANDEQKAYYEQVPSPRNTKCLQSWMVMHFNFFPKTSCRCSQNIFLFNVHSRDFGVCVFLYIALLTIFSDWSTLSETVSMFHVQNTR